jgi:gliding motility-associated-like protein
MFKRILFALICFISLSTAAFAQAITVTNVSATGHFDPVVSGNCNLGLPAITATYLSGTGTTLSGGVINCTDPCGTTTVRITMNNVRWSKNPNVNWLHGISFTPANVTIANVGLPAGWAPFASSTGSCATAGSTTTGVGFYYDGTSQQNCCPGTTANDGNPSNNWGDVLADCNFDYSFSFDLTFCNSSITTNPLAFSARGTSDYQTGCWTGVDNIGTSRIQFVLSTTPCASAIFTANPTAAAPVKTCSGSTVNYTSTLNAACGSGANVTWWTAATGGTQVGTGSPFVYDPAGSTCPAGTTLYGACCPVGSTCATRRAVTIPGTCAAALAITNVATTNPNCVTPTGSVDAVTLTGSTGAVTYTLNPGGLTNNTGIFTGLTGLNYTLTATDASGCSATANVVFVPGGTGGIPPTVTTPVVYCQGQTTGVVPLIANTTTGTGVLTWYLPGNPTGQAAAPTPSTTTAGTFVYNVTQTIGTCVSAQVPITVTINPTPAAPIVTSPVTYCQGATAVALTATGTNLLWYVPLGAGTIVTGIAPTPSTANAGTVTYQVSSTLGTCEGPKATINVIVTATPAAPVVTASIPYCQGAAAAPLTATGTNLLWYNGPIGGTGSATIPIVSTATVGNTNYYVSQTVGGCESPRAVIAVVVSATPAAPITAPVNYCQNATAVPLTATAVTGATLVWYTTATGGTGTAAPTPSTTTAGTVTYYVSQKIGSCEGPRASINVIVTATPVAPTVTPIAYCQGDVAVALTATGTNLLWYTTITGGTGTTAPIPVTTTAGTTNYYVSQSTTGTPVCEGPRALLVVTINTKPNAPTVVTPVSYCQGATAIALAATGGSNYKWYTTLTGGTASTTAPIPSTASVGSTTYYVSQSTATCEGPRASIVVNVTPALTVNAGPDVTIAGGATTQLNATATAGADYTWAPNIPVSLSNIKILNPIASPAQTTTYTLTVKDLTGSCPDVTDAVKVTVVQSCVKVRNAFSPNGDGINDKWLVYDQNFCLSTNGVKVNVFNRYGSKVYEQKGYVNNWDGTYKGKPLPDGTYFAVIEIEFFDGKQQTVRTDLTIIR